MRTLWVSLALLAGPAFSETFAIVPGPGAEATLQEALILAAPRDEVVLAQGVYDIRNQLSLAGDEVTLRGAGMAAPILSFKGQTGGAEGMTLTGNGAILKDFAIEDTKGDAIKVKGVDGFAAIRVRAEWTGGAQGRERQLRPVSGAVEERAAGRCRGQGRLGRGDLRGPKPKDHRAQFAW